MKQKKQEYKRSQAQEAQLEGMIRWYITGEKFSDDE